MVEAEEVVAACQELLYLEGGLDDPDRDYWHENRSCWRRDRVVETIRLLNPRKAYRLLRWCAESHYIENVRLNAGDRQYRYKVSVVRINADRIVAALNARGIEAEVPPVQTRPQLNTLVICGSCRKPTDLKAGKRCVHCRSRVSQELLTVLDY